MTITWLDFLILGLAAWRAASLLVKEEGPWDVFYKLRQWVGIREYRIGDASEFNKSWPDTFLGNLLNCVWCCSLWTGMALTVLYFFFPAVMIWLSMPLALSAFAVWIETRVRM